MGRYLVTGGAGYIGSHVALSLLDAGHDVVILDDLSTGHRDCIPSGCKLVLGRISSSGVLDTTFSTWKIDGIMHMASLSLVGQSMSDPYRYFRENIDNALCLVEKANRYGVKNMVFSSTAAVYGNLNPSPIREQGSNLLPVNPYGESKLMIERILDWSSKIHGLRYSALRYFNAAGADADLRSGELHDPETHLIPLAIQAALDHGKPLRIFGEDYETPDGTAIRDYVHVSDIASAHLAAMGLLEKDHPSFSANIGTGKGASVKEVIGAVERATNRKVACVPSSRRAGDPQELVANASCFMAMSGWAPRHSDLYNIVSTAAAWQIRRGTGDHSGGA